MSANKKINLIAVDMGYGHQRAVYPLLDLSNQELITLNNYPGIPGWEESYWLRNLKSYEIISRLKKIPLLGVGIFSLMDRFQRIDSFYPFRDLSKQSWQQKIFLQAIKRGLGKDLIAKLEQTKLPFVTSFFVAAYAAEYYNYSGDIYCLTCDADVSRAWGPLWPKTSRIKYFATTENVKTRLLMYGVKEGNIILTGFPLPKENIGPEKEVLLNDLSARLLRLDPKGLGIETYKQLIKINAGDETSKKITITFAVGGAGAQKEVASIILKKLAANFINGSLEINLVAGSRPEINQYFEEEIRKNRLDNLDNVRIIFAPEKMVYFEKFNRCLRTTDVLWTKPSELSFYCALGIPIIILPPVGSQEDFNRDWLLSVGAGIDCLPMNELEKWWPELLSSGRLAKAAYNGYSKAENMGTYNIEKFLFNK